MWIKRRDQCFPAFGGIDHHGFTVIGFKIKQAKITAQGNFIFAERTWQPALFGIIWNALTAEIPKPRPQRIRCAQRG